MPERMLIRGGDVMTADPRRGDLPNTDVLIEDGKIARIASDISAEGCRVVDATNSIVLPGFVDTHSHLWEWALRNIGVDWTVRDYMKVIRGILGGHYLPDDIYAGTLLGAAEALNSGVTTVLDCSHNMNSPEHADGAVRALQESGLRAVFAYGSANGHWDPESAWHGEGEFHSLPSDARRVRSEYFSGDGGLVTMALCSRGSRGEAADAVWFADVRLALELDVPITFAAGLRSRKRSTPEIVALHEEGLTGPHILCYHGDRFDDVELSILAETGGKIAYTPEVELRDGLAVPSVSRLVEFGIYPGLGVDTPAIASDYFTQMRTILAAEGALHRLEAFESGEVIEKVRLTVRQVLDLATVHGANACWLGHRTGTLTPGKEADVIVVDKQALTLLPIYHPAGSIVFNGSPQSVRTVIVGGSVAKENGALVGLDADRVVDLAVKSRESLFERAGLSRLSGEVFAD